jgi:hypothetical protein
VEAPQGGAGPPSGAAPDGASRPAWTASPPSTTPPWNKLGKLLHITHGKAKIAADVSAVESKYNALGPDSNLYAGELNGVTEKPTARV